MLERFLKGHSQGALAVAHFVQDEAEVAGEGNGGQQLLDLGFAAGYAHLHAHNELPLGCRLPIHDHRQGRRLLLLRDEEEEFLSVG